MWTVARVYPNQDRKAVENLQRQGFETFNPIFSVRRIMRNKLVYVPEQVFVGYVFIDLRPGQVWTKVNYTLGCIKMLVRRGSDGWDHPSEIQDDFIAQLKQCCEKNDKQGWRLLPGTKVRLRTGVFAQHEAIVTWSSETRARLLIHLLNRSVPLIVSVADLDVIEAPP
jgi:transcriptional antiterminator RfaH